jgi:hypothetical protein
LKANPLIRFLLEQQRVSPHSQYHPPITVILIISFASLPIDTSIHTPTRFLLHCFSESLTPSFGSRYGFEETNPFEQNFIEGPTAGDRMISVNMNMPTSVPGALSYPSPNSPPSNTSFDESCKSSPPAIRSAARAKTTIFKSQGPENFQPPKGAGGSKYKTLKHNISIEEDDDEEDMEMKRLKFLERNRQAGTYMLHSLIPTLNILLC